MESEKNSFTIGGDSIERLHLNPQSSQTLPTLSAHRKRQCGLLLQQNVTIWNFISYLLIIYLMVLGFLMSSNYMTLLIQDPEYYTVSQEQLGMIQGNLSTYISIATLPVQFFAGFIFDKCGRRATLTACSFIAATMLTILPYGQNLYPGLLVINSILLAALEIMVISPLLADYVKDRTKGCAGGYILLATGLSSTLFSFGLLQLSESVDLAYLSWIAGGIAFLISIYCLIFISDTYSRTTRASIKSSDLSNASYQSRPSCWVRAFESISYSCRITRTRKMLIAVYITGIAQRVLQLAFVTIISVWVSKYVYDGDIPKISRHNKITLGSANIAAIPIGVLLGLSYDKCGELFTLSFVFFCAGFPYIILYFLDQVNSIFGTGLQIFSATFSIITNAMASVMIGRHSPKEGAGKVYALRSFVSGIVLIGFNYFSGWMIDQPFSRVTFLVIAGVSLSQVVMFISIGLCCKKISDFPEGTEDEEVVFLFHSEV